MKGSGESLEIEVKFFAPDLESFKNQLFGSGAKLKKSRSYEKNIVFDNQEGTLASQGKLLRVRQDEGVLVTFKGESTAQMGSQVRIMEEIEIQTNDFENTAAIFRKIGFEKQLIYEKYREIYQISDVEVVLDEMPFGNFIELEGPEQELQKTAGVLSLDWSKRILDNYLKLHSRVVAWYSLPFTDVTFDNYLSIDLSDIEDVLQEVYEQLIDK